MSMQHALDWLDEVLQDGPVNTPSLRRLEKEREKRKDEEAADELCRKIEDLLLPEGDNRLQPRWRRAYRKMKEHRSELEENGSIHRKHTASPSPQLVIKFRRDKGGERVQSSIHLGPRIIGNMAALVLHAWRTGEVEDLEDMETAGDEAQDDPLRTSG